MTDHLRRALAPITDRAWEAIDEEASRTLRHFLVARALVDVDGPLGWEYAARPVGRTQPVAPGPGESVTAAVRRMQPVVELRVPFDLDLDELDTVDRGNPDPDLSAVTEAAQQAATAEDRAVFHGYPAGGIVGITEASAHDPIELAEDYDEYPRSVARALARLRGSGIGGPYALALGPRCYTGVIETTERGGYPLLEHLRLILGGPVLWAPAVDGAVVLSMRGGDFSLGLGQDFSIGYRGQTGSTVHLYLEESLVFTVAEDRAAVALVYP